MQRVDRIQPDSHQGHELAQPNYSASDVDRLAMLQLSCS